jgi:hypothetical protein
MPLAVDCVGILMRRIFPTLRERGDCKEIERNEANRDRANGE